MEKKDLYESGKVAVEIGPSSMLKGCRGIVRGERYGDCLVIEFTYVPNSYFQLPCTQVIAKKHVKVLKEDKWIKMEREHNRVSEDGYECDFCGESKVDSMFLHRHVCPNDPEHRQNYDTDYLERMLLGQE
jgi:hypothetical protein